MSIVQRLIDLAEKLRDRDGNLSEDSLTCQNAASYIGTVESCNQAYSDERGTFVTGMRTADALERIADHMDWVQRMSGEDS